MPSSPKLQVGVIGARRADQGIGQFVAGHLASLGAEVPAIVGTSEETLAAAQAELAKRYGLQVRGYKDVRQMFEAEQLDAVAICSPQRLHAEHLQAALEHGVHVLCEKPLVFTPLGDNLKAARPLVEGFAAANRVLMVNQQWPYTLGAFDQCFPAARREPITRLEMLLGPSEHGPAMIANALPHVLSLLLACAPGADRLDAPRIARCRPTVLEVSFLYVHSMGSVAVQTWLVQSPRQPRPAGYAINGSSALRKIRTSDYAMFFQPSLASLGEISLADSDTLATAAMYDDRDAQAQAVALEDPLRLLLADFISRCRAGRPATIATSEVLDGVRLLDELYAAAVEQLA